MTAEHPDPILDTPPPITIHNTPPKVRWWTTAAAAVLGMAIAVTLIVGIVSQWQGVQNERENAEFARNVAAANIVATDKARLETDCVRTRNADLTRSSAKLVKLTAELFVRLAQRDPTLSEPTNPIYAQFDQLAKQSGLDDEAVSRAVEECRQP